MATFDSSKGIWGDTGVPLAIDVRNEINKVIETVGQVSSKVSTLETAVGSTNDTANSSGSIYARIKDLSAKINTNTTAISNLTGRMTRAENNIIGLTDRMIVEEGFSTPFAVVLPWTVGC